MDLRPFRSNDLDILYAIDQACFPPGISYTREELRRFTGHRGSRTWIAEENGEIVGFLVADRQSQKVEHIITIDVVECWRHKGVGTLLMDAVESWSLQEGVQFIYLETAEPNNTAQRFYEARGYRRVGKIENYYSDGTAAWVMRKQIDFHGGVKLNAKIN